MDLNINAFSLVCSKLRVWNQIHLRIVLAAIKKTRSETDVEFSVGDNMEVSVNAIEGFHNNKTITFTGRKGRHQFAVLVDGGSTHSFIDEQVASKLKCELFKTLLMRVQVANGNHLESQYECKGFKWKVEDYEFQTSVRTLPMGGYDLVLGVDWLGSLGLVTFIIRT